MEARPRENFGVLFLEADLQDVLDNYFGDRVLSEALSVKFVI